MHSSAIKNGAKSKKVNDEVEELISSSKHSSKSNAKSVNNSIQNDSNQILIGERKEENGNIFKQLNMKNGDEKPKLIKQNSKASAQKSYGKSFKEDENNNNNKDNMIDKSSISKRSEQSKQSEKSEKNGSFSDNSSQQNDDNDSNEGFEEKDPEWVNRKLYKREKICDTDSEDEGSDTEKEVFWILLPDNTYKRWWDLFIAIVILYSSIVTPYELAFIEKNKDSAWDTFLDVMLWWDIFITFFSAYTDSEENLVKSRKRIILSYLKSWFVVDFVSVLPINQMTPKSFSFNKITRISRLPKLYRLLKLTKLLRMTKMTSQGNVNKVTKFFLEKLKVNANIERLLFFILTFLLLNHWCACFWYFMARLEEFSPDSWVVRLGYIDSSNLELYIISFYWTLTTVTTVGYGDINAGTTIERVYNLFIMSFGVLLYSFAIGSLSSIVSTLDQKTAEMNQKLQILSSIKKEFNLDQTIYDKVRKVIKFDLSRNQNDKMLFLQELPNKLKIELSQIMHDKVIQNWYFFRDQPNDFFAYVAPLLKPVKFSQNDYLYKCQDMIDEMYFVSKGTVIFCLDKKYDEKEIKEIKKNNNFGEIEMCLNEKLTYNIKIKSRNCELFVLKKNDFLRLSVNFKEFIENFWKKSLMRYLKFTEEKNKMIKEFETLMSKCNGGNLNNSMNKSGVMQKDLQAIEEVKDDEGNEISSESSNDSESNQENVSNKSENQKFKLLNKDIKKKETIELKDGENTNTVNLIDINNINDKETNRDQEKEKDKQNKEETLNSGDENSVNKMKNQINSKFQKKIDRIIEFIDKNNFQFEKGKMNPKELLVQLKNENNFVIKNKILDQIENILKEFYSSNMNLSNMNPPQFDKFSDESSNK